MVNTDGLAARALYINLCTKSPRVYTVMLFLVEQNVDNRVRLRVKLKHRRISNQNGIANPRVVVDAHARRTAMAAATCFVFQQCARQPPPAPAAHQHAVRRGARRVEHQQRRVARHMFVKKTLRCGGRVETAQFS
ncbi:PhcyNPV031 [Philosamia cynthia ricini nucleopolyhedrovirus virus]|nr:PhcyNPV031 [Philosamia cynthia ricini nucleopolyhedrovirus virus]